MVTIDFNSFWSEQDELKESCIEFIQNILGPSEKVTILKEDENDPESSFSVFLNYSKYTLNDFNFYDELMDFARENELYVIVYDHNTKSRKGYWYDEDDEWIEQDMGDNADYPL
jgi:hypothetical protein